jgi:hypothetical protein
MDGFISLFDKNSGAFVKSRRIASKDRVDDFIVGLCTTNTATQPDHFYIVGATGGQIDPNKPGPDPAAAQAFLMKIKVDTLETTWMSIVTAKSEDSRTLGVACAVTPDDDAVYLAGVVQDGVVLERAGTTNSFGKDDIFITKIDTVDGSQKFIRQFGSAEDDAIQ